MFKPYQATAEARLLRHHSAPTALHAAGTNLDSCALRLLTRDMHLCEDINALLTEASGRVFAQPAVIFFEE